MSERPTILAPVDFSPASRSALRYARVIAEHFGARLVILTVEDPLLTEAIDLGTGVVWDPEDTRRELAHFASETLGGNPLKTADVEYEVAVGKPAKEILQVAKEKPCDLIIISTHGLTGVRKMFFGSTTERVLRETTVPVLAVPSTNAAPQSSEDIRRSIGRILVPVDLSQASMYQVQIARGLSEALRVPLLATYVVEPVRSPLAAKLHLPSVETERRARAEDALSELLATVPRELHPEALVAYGDPAEEIAKVARDRKAGLIVIGLHGSPALGPRMGSVTYRVLSLVSTLVLALPPKQVGGASSVPPPLHSFVHK
ncbi:MAG TPA: universal stress protein [Vicinamibacterales bacterium]